MSRRVLAALAAATLMLGLAACGNEGEGPVTTPPPPVANGPSDDGGSSPEPSDGGGETEEPEVAAPDVPAPDPADYPGMDEETPEGAEQALRYYIAVVYWGYQTGDTETLETLHTENCEQCEEITNEIRDISNSGAYWNSAQISKVGSDREESDTFDQQVSYAFRIGAHERIDPQTSEPIEVSEVPYTALAGMLWTDEQWAVERILLAESQHAD